MTLCIFYPCFFSFFIAFLMTLRHQNDNFIHEKHPQTLINRSFYSYFTHDPCQFFPKPFISGTMTLSQGHFSPKYPLRVIIFSITGSSPFHHIANIFPTNQYIGFSVVGAGSKPAQRLAPLTLMDCRGIAILASGKVCCALGKMLPHPTSHIPHRPIE